QRGADGVERHERQGHAGSVRLVEEEGLLERRVALAAILAGPTEAELAVLAPLAHEVAVRGTARLPTPELGAPLPGHEPGEVVAQLGLQRALLGRQIDVHEASVSEPSIPARSERRMETSGPTRSGPVRRRSGVRSADPVAQPVLVLLEPVRDPTRAACRHED